MFLVTQVFDINNAIKDVLNKDNDMYVHQLQMGCLFIAEMFLTARDIKLKLDSGINVICDRWWYSTLAYAGDTDEHIDSLYNIIKGNLIDSDVIIYLKVDTNVALNRIRNRSDEVEVYDTKDKLDRISKRYDAAFSKTLEHPTKLIFCDANVAPDILSTVVKTKLESL